MFVLSVTFLSPCGACWPGTWWVPFFRIFGPGLIGAGAGWLIRIYLMRGPL
jgi:hypothetical protein